LLGQAQNSETYLNIVEFGEGIYGVEAAAQHYFRKPASRLSREEAASLAAVLPNPRRYKVTSPGPTCASGSSGSFSRMNQLGGSSLVKKFE
jgi:monofunctional biosynthetic peptidoglycan transglycosylase